jgi:hypothetical protein
LVFLSSSSSFTPISSDRFPILLTFLYSSKGEKSFSVGSSY